MVVGDDIDRSARGQGGGESKVECHKLNLLRRILNVRDDDTYTAVLDTYEAIDNRDRHRREEERPGHRPQAALRYFSLS